MLDLRCHRQAIADCCGVGCAVKDRHTFEPAIILRHRRPQYNYLFPLLEVFRHIPFALTFPLHPP